LGWGLYWTPLGEAFFKEGHDEGWRNYAVCFDQSESCLVIMTNSGNGEGIFKELLETLQRNTYTPIEWEGYTPYDKLPPQHKQVAVDTKLFDGYVGDYALAPSMVVTVTREGDHLFVQSAGFPKVEMYPEDERNYFLKVIDMQITFITDSKGRAVEVVVRNSGADTQGKRIK